MLRVIWQYDSNVIGDFHSESLASAERLFENGRAIFRDLDLVGPPEPVFGEPKVALRAEMLAMASDFAEESALDLAGYHHAFARDRERAEALRDRLLNTPGIATVEIQGRPTQPVRFEVRRERARVAEIAASLHPSATRNLVNHQAYLNPAPGGIDARFAWNVAGGRGEGIRIVDIEYGWNFLHEDLIEVQGGVIFGPNADDDHGTAVLGIYSGDSNGVGIEGIANRAVATAASAEFDVNAVDPDDGRVLSKWNAARAIHSVIRRLSSGDVILLEMHGPGPNTPDPVLSTQDGYVPIEFWSPEFAAIRYATMRGIYVIEASGNGGEDLDDAVYGGRFDRGQRDSGAIVVGAGASSRHPDQRSRLDFSNFGSRLDVQGWGEDIATTGGRSADHYHDLVSHQEPSRCYTDSFGGTSGASPIVVGATASIAGAVKAAGQPALTPVQMRNLLRDTGSPQTAKPTAPVSQHIGPLPDLKSALDALGLA